MWNFIRCMGFDNANLREAVPIKHLLSLDLENQIFYVISSSIVNQTHHNLLLFIATF